MKEGRVGSYDRCKVQCARLFWRLLSVRRVASSGCGEQDAGATATADQALIRASKAHTGMRREFPVLSRENTASAALQPTLGNSLTGSGTLATASSLFWIRLLIGPTPCRRSRCQSLRIAA